MNRMHAEDILKVSLDCHCNCAEHACLQLFITPNNKAKNFGPEL